MQPRDIEDMREVRDPKPRDVPEDTLVDPLELSRMEDEGCPNDGLHTRMNP